VAVSTSNRPTDQGYDPNRFAAMYLDGRMRAVHGYHTAICANGKVWFHHQSSPAGVGNSTSHAWQFDRSYAPGGTEGAIPATPGGAPLRWANTPGPWTWLGTTESGEQDPTSIGESFGLAPPSAFDPVTGLIWTAHANQSARVWSSLDTAAGAIRRSRDVDAFAMNTGQNTRWAAVVSDPSGQDRWRFWVAPAPSANGVTVLNLKARDPYSASAWSIRPVSDLSAINGRGLGAVYHGPSTAILLGDLKSYGRTFLKLRVPTLVDGRYDAAATWQVSTVTPATDSADPTTGLGSDQNGAWSKFNIISDMGNGQSALVVCMEVDQPTYVYKLPRAGV